MAMEKTKEQGLESILFTVMGSVFQNTLLGPEVRSKAFQSSFSCHIDKFEGNLSSAIAQTRKIHEKE